jgi:hypothetical protein
MRPIGQWPLAERGAGFAEAARAVLEGRAAIKAP